MEDQLSTIHHTYLRYECADAFGISVASGSSKAPASHQVIVAGRGVSNPFLYTIAGSTIHVWDVKSSLQPIYKIGHVSTANIGSGSALNDNEVVCVHVSASNVATGWIDGTVRIFEVDTSKIASASSQPPHNSLLDDRNAASSNDRLWQTDPLVLNGHTSPVRTITLDDANRSQTNSRCASGGSDGSIILWDIIAETGLFRFLGHRAGISDLSFFAAPNDQRDLLLSCSLDGLVKIWDIANQCCIQTLTNYRGHEVLTGALALTLPSPSEEDRRFRFITGGSNGQTMVWSMVSSSASTNGKNPVVGISDKNNEGFSSLAADPLNPVNDGRTADDILQLMGYLKPPDNIAVNASDKIMSIRISGQQRYVGVQRGEKSLDVYSIRSLTETQKKRLRRIKRRQEKFKKKQKEEGLQERPTKTKRGLLDDDESDGPAIVDEEMGDNKTIDFDPELVQASDEFEYLVTLRTTAKIRGFCFYPKDTRHSKNVELCRIVCALSSNALETYSIQKRPEEASAG
jgi:U3 small nucleolar RNA-associated protein 12